MPFEDENSIAIWFGDVFDDPFLPRVATKSIPASVWVAAVRQPMCNATTQQTCHIKGLKIFTVVGSAVGPPVWKCANMEGSVSAQEHPFWPQASRLECSSPASKGSFTGNLSRFRDNSRSPNPGSDDKELRQGANWRLMTDPWRHQVLCACMSRLLLKGDNIGKVLMGCNEKWAWMENTALAAKMQISADQNESGSAPVQTCFPHFVLENPADVPFIILTLPRISGRTARERRRTSCWPDSFSPTVVEILWTQLGER